jgi:hypothetical protein
MNRARCMLSAALGKEEKNYGPILHGNSSDPHSGPRRE